LKISLFVPCFIDQCYPGIAFQAIQLLEQSGCTVHYNSKQTCCGQPAFNSGYWDEAKEVGTKFLEDFAGAGTVVSLSGSCKGMILNYYNDLFTNSLLHNPCRTLQSNIFEFSEFLVNQMHFLDFNAELHGKAVYHDSCGALRECGIKSEPRELLKKVKGLELLEAPDSEVCCGFGGTFSVKFDGISAAMAEQKVKNAMNMGADYIISVDVSCLMHLDGYIQKNGLPIQTLHLTEVLSNSTNS
jgi:L-lactate dehydrogenase complex protein LldE